VSAMKFRNGKVVHETEYFSDPFDAPAWRRQCVQQTAWRRTADEEICLADGRPLTPGSEIFLLVEASETA
jgi:hypothetical protein